LYRIHFYKLACAGDVYNVGIKMSGKEGITRFKYENGNMIIFIPDIKAVIQTIQISNIKS
jgi:predicted RNA-binding protein with TRAM domain